MGSRDRPRLHQPGSLSRSGGLFGLAHARLCLMIKPSEDEKDGNERGEDAGSDPSAPW